MWQIYKDFFKSSRHSDCKITLAPCHLLFIAWQIVHKWCDDDCVSNWESPHLGGREGTHTHTHTQVNGNSCWHCHGKCLSVSRLGAIWLDLTRKGKKSSQRITGWTQTQSQNNMLQFGWPNVCSVCTCQKHNKCPHFMNNSSESNWSGQCNTAKNRHFACGTLINNYIINGNYARNYFLSYEVWI